ncbi:MAG: xylono,5-lactonase [Sphingomonadales bacterium]|nr:xylono,5-lactonase [Sphingomonadales bacterium]
MLADSTVRCVSNVHAVLGEGPVWVTRETALYWLDIKGQMIFRLDEGERLTKWPTPMRIGSIAPRKSGGFIGGTEHGIAIIDPAADRFELVAKPEEHLPNNRFNDGKVDRRGRFWAGTMDDRERDATGTLYCIDTDLSWAALDDGYKVTNGPAFSPSGKIMYHNDSARRVTYAFDMDSAGQPGNRRVFLKFGEGDGYPDGMTVDADGCLWIAFWDGGCIRRFSPKGEWLQTIEMPVSRPTSCAFGGRDLDRLYITSASVGLDASQLSLQPNAGGLFMVIPGVQGIADVPFAG